MRIKNCGKHTESLADAIYRMSFRGGGIGANVVHIEQFEDDYDNEDVNDNLFEQIIPLL